MSNPFIFARAVRGLRAAAIALGLAVAAIGSAPVRADAPSAHTYALDAAPLTVALGRFAAASGVALTFSSEQVGDGRAPALRGSYTVEQGFAQLLADTPLQAVRQDDGSYVLQRRPARDGAVTLMPAVKVTADAETAASHVDGYVATRSATGTKTDTPLIETPQSITVLTSDQLARQGLQTSVAQALRYAGGVVSEPRGDMTSFDFFYARGFALNQYLDGLKTLSEGYTPQPDPYLLERVEVLRGPASVLYGQADPGGVVNLVSKRADGTPIHELQIQGGSYGRLQGAFDLGDTLDAQGHWAARIVGVGRDADAQVDHAREQRRAVAPSLRWQPGDDLSLTLLGNYQNDPHVGYYNWTPSLGTVRPNPNGPQLSTSLDTGEPDYDRYERSTKALTDILDYRISDIFSVQQSLRYEHQDSLFNQIYVSYLDDDQRTLQRYAWHYRNSLDTLRADQHLQAKFATGWIQHTLIAGFDYQYTRDRERLGYNFDSGTDPGQVPPLDIYAPVYGHDIAVPDFASDIRGKQVQRGVYAQDQAAIGRLRVLLGGRQDWARTDSHEGFDPSGESDGHLNDHAFTGRAGAVYLFDSGVAPYASYTESFQPTSGVDDAGYPYKPTEGKQYEAGVKYEPKGMRASVTLSAYQLTQSNVVATDVSDPLHGGQIGEIRSRGVELNGLAELTRELNLIASFSHVDQKVTAGAIDFGPSKGRKPTGIPADAATLWADYTRHSGPLSGAGAGIGARYIGSTWGNDDNTLRVPSYTLVDTALFYALDPGAGLLQGWRFALNVSNLFDRTYVASCSGDDYCAYGARRNWLLTAGKRW